MGSEVPNRPPLTSFDPPARGSSRSLVACFWKEIEFAAVEEDADPVVSKRTETAGSRLDGLDSAVEAFALRVGNRVVKVS